MVDLNFLQHKGSFSLTHNGSGIYALELSYIVDNTRCYKTLEATELQKLDDMYVAFMLELPMLKETASQVTSGVM